MSTLDHNFESNREVPTKKAQKYMKKNMNDGNEEIPDLTKHKDNFKTLLMLLSCQDSFNALAEKWETDFPDQPIPEGFKNMMEIQFEFMRGMLGQNPEFPLTDKDISIPENIKLMSIPELIEGLRNFDHTLQNWDENESGADHICMIKKWYELELCKRIKPIPPEFQKVIEEDFWGSPY